MLAALWFTAVLAAAPAPAAPTPAPATPPAAPPAASAPRTLKLAAPGLQGVDVAQQKAQFLNDLFAEQLGSRSEKRISVITQSEVGSLLGFERQKQLLGCSDGSSQCLAEISGALGVDGLVVGNVAKFGDSYAMTLKVIDAADGHPLASASRTGMREEQLLEWTKQQAAEFARALAPAPASRAGTASSAAAPLSTETAAVVSRAPQMRHNSLWLSLLGIEYDRRLRGGPSWIGVRFAGSVGLALTGNLTAQSQLFAMARYSPLRPEDDWNWSLYGGLGLGAWGSSPLRKLDGMAGFSGTLGVEGGYQGLRASVEAQLLHGYLVIIPGLSFAVTF